MSKRTILFILLMAIMVLVIIGYSLYQKGPRDVQLEKGLAIEAKELYKLYATDSAKAQTQYTDKILEVKGQIKEVQQNNKQQTVVLIDSGVDGASVNCTLEGKDEGLKSGETVTLKGIATGMGQGDVDLGIPGDVYIIRAYIKK